MLETPQTLRDTHVVFNQPAPLAGINLFETDQPLQDGLRHLMPGLDLSPLRALGRVVARADMQEHARLANAHPPQLRTHDRFGRRLDEVEFHPSYHALMALATQAGLHAAPWVEGRPGGQVLRAAGFMLAMQLEPGVMCPVSMTYAAAPALRHHPALHAAWGPGLGARAYDPRLAPWKDKPGLTMGMGMTEKQGGSDVRANTTRAEADGADTWGPRYRLTGHKWFLSAPMSDAFLVLAQAGDGLTCFFLPRVLPDGSLNSLRLQRLKDKLGNRANASAEVEFQGALAWRVGEAGRGIARILEMGALTRLDCALGTSGLMRQAIGAVAESTTEAKPLILLTTFPQESHGLGLLMAECMMVLQGARCLSLGTQTPLRDIVQAAQAHRVHVVALSFSATMNPNHVLDGLAELRRALPANVEIWAGGRCPILRRRRVDGVQVLHDLDQIGDEVKRWVAAAA